MNSRASTPLGKLIAISSVLVLAIVLVACEQSKQTGAGPTPNRSAAETEKVYVIFEGPWAVVDDPADANSILVLAPKTKVHNDLFVAASNDSFLAAGKYELSVPAHGAPASSPLDATFAQAKIDAKSLQHALDDTSGRYVVRLPKPEAYLADRRFLSRVESTYPPGASTEQNYVAMVSFRYSVGSLNGFSLSGTPDTGTFNPLLLQLDTPTIRFAIEQTDVLPDSCHNHSRGAFRDTVKYLGLKLYVDFPNDSQDCHKTDPQITGAAKAAANRTSMERLAGLLSGELIDAQTASASTTVPSMAAFYLFHAADGGCKAPILFLTVSP